MDLDIYHSVFHNAMMGLVDAWADPKQWASFNSSSCHGSHLLKHLMVNTFRWAHPMRASKIDGLSGVSAEYLLVAVAEHKYHLSQIR